MDGQKAIREEEKLLKKVDAMKKKRTLEWLTKVCLEIKNDISIGEIIVE